jgi:uncharacterized delta-60 repeat protein
MALQRDGKIVLVGQASYDNNSGDTVFGLMRLNSDGVQDSTFGGNGELLVTMPNSNVNSVNVQTTGRIVVSGYANIANPSGSNTTGVAIARLNANGSLDPTFENGGRLFLPVTQHANPSRALALQQDEKFVFVGWGLNHLSNSSDFLVTRIVPGLPALSINNVPATNEGSATAPNSATFTVTLSNAFPQTVTVNYQTSDGSGTAGSDYSARTGTLTFAPGEVSKAVRVNFIGDSVAEANETFFLNLSSPTNATLTNSRGSALIGNDDGPQLTIADAPPLLEGHTSTRPQTFTVRLSAASSNTVTVNWATANITAGAADYIAAFGALTFAPGQTSKTLTVQVKGDTIVEPDESYRVILSKPNYATIADGDGIGSIRNDDTASTALMNGTVNDGWNTEHDEPSQ